MREILFRGKRVDNGEWVEGYCCKREDMKGDFIDAFIILDAYEQISYGQRYLRSNLSHECFQVDPATIGQYTGLKDCRGQRIFEGDILRPVWGNEYFLVGWRDEYADFDLVNCTGVSLPSDHDRMEIVGTIHDNPELLGRGCVDG